jgi:hypothetical protein
MADRRQRSLVVAAVAIAALALPAGASAGLSPWLVGASPMAAPDAPVVPTVDIRYRGRVERPCRGRTTLTVVRGGLPLQRRTLRLGRDCRVSTTFRVARDEAAQLRVLQHYRGRTTSAQLLAPWLGSRGLDERPAAPAALAF